MLQNTIAMSEYTEPYYRCDVVLKMIYDEFQYKSGNASKLQGQNGITLDQIRVAIRTLKNDDYIVTADSNLFVVRITSKGESFLSSGGYKTQFATDTEKKSLENRKLALDVKNANRIYRTYWITFWLSVAGFITAATLAILKITEVIKSQN